MKLGILGTGYVATVLDGAWTKRHEVTPGSRGLACPNSSNIRVVH